jgi:rhodanese-related sulfurtransferase
MNGTNKILVEQYVKPLISKIGWAICIWAFLAASQIFCYTGTDIPRGKQTVLHLYVTAEQAHAMWLKNPDSVIIIDTRTPEEYVFTGHSLMGFNIPVAFMTHQFDIRNRQYHMRPNPDFVQMVASRFNKNQTLLILCRSGQRSAWAVNQLAKAGFQRVYNITDGFEGDIFNQPGHPEHGRRIVNGWKNADLPWTYMLDPEKIYTPSQ